MINSDWRFSTRVRHRARTSPLPMHYPNMVWRGKHRQTIPGGQPCPGKLKRAAWYRQADLALLSV